MRIVISCKTDRFNLSVMKNNFINDSSYGEDFAKWLANKLNQDPTQCVVEELLSFGWHCSLAYEDSYYSLYINGYSDDVLNHPNQGTWRIKIERERSIFEKLLLRNLITINDEAVVLISKMLQEEAFEDVSISEE